MMKSINKLVKNLLDPEYGYSLTDNIETAIYLLPDGQMIDGNFMDGMRNEDHRMIFTAVDYGDYYESRNPGETHWDRLHREYRVARLVPESDIALVRSRQRLTEQQQNILNQSSYTIERY